MIVEIILIIAFILSLIMIKVDDLNDAVWFTIAMVLGCIILFGLSISTGENDSYNYVKIVSLDRDTGIEGHFTLGSGSINSYPVYYAYTKLSDGGYKLEQFKNVVLYEDDSVEPHYEYKTTCKRKTNLFNWIGDCTTTSKLFVPSGTILKEYRG